MSETDDIEQDQAVAGALQAAQDHMRNGGFRAALAVLDGLAQEQQNHVDVLFLRAVCQRYDGVFASARTTLQTLKALAPDFGRALQEEGHIFRMQRDIGAATRAYHQAVQLNPGLLSSWQHLGTLLHQLGEADRAAHAQEQVKRLKALPKSLFAAMNSLHDGKIARAEDICRQYLRQNPKDTDGMRLLADIGERFGAMDEAEFLLESAVEFEPDNLDLRLAYVDILRKRQKFDSALEQAEILYQRSPDNPVIKSQLAIQTMQAGDFEGAIDLYDEVIDQLPADPALWTAKGHAQKTYGQQAAAVQSYKKAAAVQPDYGEAYFALSNLKTYRFGNDEIATMRKQVDRAELSSKDRMLFSFALGKAYEDRESYEDAFGFYEQANAIGRQRSNYKAETMTAEFQAQIDICGAELFDGVAAGGFAAPDPIFIVGLPRAGSTLLEQIIASHSQVDGTHELSNILSLAHKLRGKGRSTAQSSYPAILNELTPAQRRKMGEAFIADTRIHRGDAPFFIDKMPNNFRHIGLINLILPNAKIIDARRHPMACCFSGFKQHFAEGQEFTYGLTEIGRYYRDYVGLMDHWDEVLPEKILRVHYEDVVADIDTQVRRILDYLELPFEEACVDFHKTKRSVRTASSEQVRQPIYKAGLEQWRNFGPWLDPLKTALGPLVDNYSATAS